MAERKKSQRLPASDSVVITCEHGGNRVPAKYRQLFEGHEDVLATHRGYDLGALVLARDMALAIDAPLIASTTTRLLVDLNRSIGHRDLFSTFTRPLPPSARAEILNAYYFPHRSKVEQQIACQVERGRRVIHIASHSFTPVLNGVKREADIGVLYRASDPQEAAFGYRWQAAFKHRDPSLKVRRNYPYNGASDAICIYLRRRFPSMYLGIELEVNQAFSIGKERQWRRVRQAVVESLRVALEAGVTGR